MWCAPPWLVAELRAGRGPRPGSGGCGLAAESGAGAEQGWEVPLQANMGAGPGPAAPSLSLPPPGMFLLAPPERVCPTGVELLRAADIYTTELNLLSQDWCHKLILLQGLVMILEPLQVPICRRTRRLVCLVLWLG